MDILNFFQHPFFSIYGAIMTLISIIIVIVIGVMAIRRIVPVWYRLGRGLSERKIAILAVEDEYGNLKKMILDSGLFKKKNIVQVNKENFNEAKNFSMLLVHWKTFENEIDRIISIKNDKDALIVYAPPDEGDIDPEKMKKIRTERNTTVVNFKGRLLSDIFIAMITTGLRNK